eukprot:g79467.t1
MAVSSSKIGSSSSSSSGIIAAIEEEGEEKPLAASSSPVISPSLSLSVILLGLLLELLLELLELLLELVLLSLTGGWSPPTSSWSRCSHQAKAGKPGAELPLSHPGELASSVTKPEPRQHRQSPIRRHRRPQRIRVVAVCILWLLLIFLSPDKLTVLDSEVELSECFVQSFHFLIALAARRANHQTLEDVVQVDTSIIPTVGRCTRADGIHGQNGGVCNYLILMYNLSVGGETPSQSLLPVLLDNADRFRPSDPGF